MKEKSIFEVCGRVNGYDFIESVMGVSQMSFPTLRDFGRVRAHVHECGDCTHRVGSSIEEFSTGNPRFSMRRYNAGLKYLDHFNGYHRKAP